MTVELIQFRGDDRKMLREVAALLRKLNPDPDPAVAYLIGRLDGLAGRFPEGSRDAQT